MQSVVCVSLASRSYYNLDTGLLCQTFMPSIPGGPKLKHQVGLGTLQNLRAALCSVDTLDLTALKK